MATADESENPLLSLSADKQAQLVDLVEQGDIDAIANETGLSRRQVILAGVSLAVGATAGGVTADQLIQEAQAAASTSDSDGNVGTPSDRVDVFAEGVDSNSVTTEKELNNVLVAPLPGQSSDIGQEVQTIHDNDASDGDVIFVAPGDYTQSTQITLTKQVTLYSPARSLLGRLTRFDKDGDFVQLRSESQAAVYGISFVSFNNSGDSSTGVELTERTVFYGSTRSQGNHGLFVKQESGSNLNRARVTLRTTDNAGDGLRVENTTANAVNINSGRYEVVGAYNNGGNGVNVIDGLSRQIVCHIANQNGNRGVRHAATGDIVIIGRTENNGSSGSSGLRNPGASDTFYLFGDLKDGVFNDAYPNGNAFIGRQEATKFIFRPPAYSDADRPANYGGIGEGAVIYNDGDNNLNISTGGGTFILPDGTST